MACKQVTDDGNQERHIGRQLNKSRWSPVHTLKNNGSKTAVSKINASTAHG